MDAMKLMKEHKIGCLPVVNGDELVGLISEQDFLRITARLLDRL
jgi:CBS domain-containing protein